MQVDPIQWLSALVTFVAAFVVGVLAHRSPKGNWQFIKEGPALAIFFISGALATAESAPRWVAGSVDLDCQTRWNPEELRMEQECNWTGEFGHIEQPAFNPFLWVGDVVVSMVLDGPAELAGGAIGIGIARSRDKAGRS